MKVTKGGVTAAAGFKASGIHCGIKNSRKPDLTVIASDVLANAAGVFTTNSVKAAPVTVSQKHIQSGKAQAIVCNSGNANCFTGKIGQIHAKEMTKITAKCLNVKMNNVIVASTGIIGETLPFPKIKNAIPKVIRNLSKAGGKKAAQGILTTDAGTKEKAVTVAINGKKITIGGCAKGAGMIDPNMATMLAFITTDVAISSKLLKTALKEAVEPTFNSITVDGCMSTNDMVVLMANGFAKNKTITKKGKEYQTFVNALKYVCLDLAKKIVQDGEGATKLIEITVNGAPSYKTAQKVGFLIANSVLVKTAAFGSNPNWGRVAQAVGTAGLKVTEKNLKIKFSSFKKKHIHIRVNLNLGKHSSTVYASDLSHEYVKINGEYN